MMDSQRTNGVSFGPQIKASQVKKSDSEIGPFMKPIVFHNFVQEGERCYSAHQQWTFHQVNLG